MTLLQTDLGPSVERWGLPLVMLGIVLFCVGWVARRWIWPYFQRQLDRADKKADAAEDVLRETLAETKAQIIRAEERTERADRMRETVLKDISDAMQEQARVLRKISQDIDSLRER